jgi:hypothetical protein
MKRALAAYLFHPDPLVATGNLIALVLGWNTPFYPFYLRWAAGAQAWPWGFLTLCVLPLFLAVPPLGRRNALAGRLLLALVGFGNIVFCTWLLGVASGTELFLMPCVLLPALIFRRAEWPALLPLIALPLAAYYLLHDHYPSPPVAWTADASAGMFALSAGSAGCLMGFFALLVSRPAPEPANTCR